MSEVQFRGSFVATITPFADGRVDENAYQSFIEWQVEQGTDGLVPCGTTGESPTLSHAEHMRVTELCIEAAAGRVPVVAGAGSNSTDEALLLARHAEQVGARRSSGRDTLLQQTDPGRALSAFQGDRRCGQHSGPDL